MFRNLLWAVGLVAIIGFIYWLAGAMGLRSGVIEVNNTLQLARVAAFFVVGLTLLGVYSAAAMITALKSR